MPVPIPMSVERGPAQAAYDEAADVLVAGTSMPGAMSPGSARATRCFMARRCTCWRGSAARAKVEIVPGVTSLTAAAAAIARPLAARNEILKVLPAPLPDETLRRELADAPAVAIIKVGRHFDRIRTLLGETGHAARRGGGRARHHDAAAHHAARRVRP